MSNPRDHLHRFLFNDSNVRGELVRLDDTWQAALSGEPHRSISRSIKIDLGNQRARYLRLEFYNDEEWTFLSEVRFLAPFSSVEQAVDR